MKNILTCVLILILILLFKSIFFTAPKGVYTVGKEIIVSGVVWDEPKRNQYGQRIDFQELILSVPEYPQYRFGDSITARGVVEINEFEGGSGEMIQEKILKNPTITRDPSNIFMTSIVLMRERVINVVKRTLPTSESALLLGITLGVRSEFSKPLLDMFTTTGVMHVVAASGSNVATLTGVVLFSLNLIFKRQIAIVLTAVVAMWYMVLSGFDPPIIRASIMALVTLTAQILGKQNISLFALFLTCWIMLLIDPYLLIDVGFQLSVSATAGIILIKPLVDKGIRIPHIIKDDFSTTVSAQLATLPILIGVFGSFAPVSLFVNLFVLWTVPIIMMLGLCTAVGSLIHEVVAMPFLYAAYPFLTYFIYSVELSSEYVRPFQISYFNQFFSASYYLITASIVIYIYKKSHEKG